MAGNPGAPGRFSQNTFVRTCSPENRTLLPGPCRFVSSPRYVDRALQLTHDLAQLLQCLIGFAILAQDHKIIGISHDTTAEALVCTENLKSDHSGDEVRPGWRVN